MKILLIGHGKMGKAIEEFAIQRGHSLVACVDVNDTDIIFVVSFTSISDTIVYTLFA